MAEIVSEPGNRPGPIAEAIVPIEPVVETKEVPVEDVEVDPMSYKAMMDETVTTYVDKILDFSKLPRTEENLDKVMMNLSNKLETWLSEGDFMLEEIDDREYATHFLEEACKRRGLPNDTKSWKKILKGIS